MHGCAICFLLVCRVYLFIGGFYSTLTGKNQKSQKKKETNTRISSDRLSSVGGSNVEENRSATDRNWTKTHPPHVKQSKKESNPVPWPYRWWCWRCPSAFADPSWPFEVSRWPAETCVGACVLGRDWRASPVSCACRLATSLAGHWPPRSSTAKSRDGNSRNGKER